MNCKDYIYQKPDIVQKIGDEKAEEDNLWKTRWLKKPYQGHERDEKEM